MLSSFNEVVIYDNGSTDQTLSIAKKFLNVSLHQGKFLGFGPTHNQASRLAKNDWIFSIDSDEVPTFELLQEIKALSLERGVVYSISRSNRYRGQEIKGCGWSPDTVFRIYHRLDTQFSDAQVHEKILTQNLKIKPLKNPIDHYSYENIHDFLNKMQHYSDLFAKDKQGKVNASPLKAILHSTFTFFKCYFLKRGFLDGYAGFLISSYNAHTAFYKYLKLYEKNLDLNA